MRFLSRNLTVQRLALLVAHDRLVTAVSEMPYTSAWVAACAELAALDTRIVRLEAA